MLSLQRGDSMDLQEVTKMSMEIRKQYHALERQLHEQEWTTEEDALPAKIGDCVWGLAVLAERSGIDFSEAVEDFLKTRLEDLSKI